MYDGELNAEKFDNWIRQIEVHCRIQRIIDEETMIQLASLKMGGTTLVWWEIMTKQDLKKFGKTLSSWLDFTSVIRFTKEILSSSLHVKSYYVMA